MVRWFFTLLLAAPLLCSPAFAGTKDCKDCEDYRHGIHRQVIPTDDLVCFWFVQPQPGRVLLKLAQRSGPPRSYTKNARTHDRICVGRHWVRAATDESFICDDKNVFRYALPGMIESMAVKAKNSREHEACLFGREKCGEMGYPVKRD